MTIDPLAIRDAIRQGDGPRVRDLMRGATEADRRSCARALGPPLFPSGGRMDLADPAGFHPRFADPEEHREYHRRQEREQQEYARVRGWVPERAARLGLAGVAVAVSSAGGDYSYGRDAEAELDLMAGILADRGPGWLAEFAARHVAGEYYWQWGAWPLVRRLVRVGAIGRPDVPEYITRLPEGLCPVVHDRKGDWGRALSPLQALLADPGLLADEVWRLFTVPGAARSLREYDSRADSGQGWADALAQLAEQGRLDRGRLLDACLDAFTRDFAPHHVAWYAAFHDRLCPSLAEGQARTARYLELLAAGSGTGVAVGQRGARLLLEAGLLEPGRLLAASAPPLLFPQKSIALAQLKLIGKVAQRMPVSRSSALVTAAVAFGHQREDIQAAALALIRRHGGRGGQHLTGSGHDLAAISALSRDLSPSLRAEAAALGLDPSVPPPAAGPGTIQPVAQLDELADGIAALPAAAEAGLRAALIAARQGQIAGPAPVLPSPGRPLLPVEDPEELVQLLTALLEDATDALAAERALAGAVRLAAIPERHRAELAAPLVRRAENRAAGDDYAGPFSGRDITADIARVTLAWGTDRGPAWISESGEDISWYRSSQQRGLIPVTRSGQPLTMAGIFSARAREAVRLICAGQPALLLAEPEFDRGAISHDRLLQRLQARHATAAGTPGTRHDLEAALLRLAPGAGQDLWSQWRRLAAGRAAARRAYQQAQAQIQFEPVTGLPAGTKPHRQRTRWHPHVLARIAGPPPAATARSAWARMTALSDPLADHVRLYAPRWDDGVDYRPIVAAWPLICPWQPELTAAHLLRPLSDGLGPGTSPAATALDCLAHPGHPLGPVGHLALLTGLASTDPGTRITAADTWTQAALDGRLNPQLAAAAITAGKPGNALSLARIADGLAHTAPEPVAAYRIVQTISTAAARLASAPPPNLHLLLELAARLAATVGRPPVPAPILALASRSGRPATRLATTAARLAQPIPDQPPDRAQAAADALAALVTRANTTTTSRAE